MSATDARPSPPHTTNIVYPFLFFAHRLNYSDFNQISRLITIRRSICLERIYNFYSYLRIVLYFPADWVLKLKPVLVVAIGSPICWYHRCPTGWYDRIRFIIRINSPFSTIIFLHNKSSADVLFRIGSTTYTSAEKHASFIHANRKLLFRNWNRVTNKISRDSIEWKRVRLRHQVTSE